MRDKRLVTVVGRHGYVPTGATSVIKTSVFTVAKEDACDTTVVRLAESSSGVVERMLEMNVCEAAPDTIWGGAAKLATVKCGD